MHYMLKEKFHIQILICISAVFFLGILLLRDGVQRINISAPAFSLQSGFYEDNFFLEIEADEGTTIYYTLDGSTPNENSNVYTEPILIDNASEHENVYSMRTDTSAGFRTELIAHYKTRDAVPGYMQPDYLIDKCTVVRAIAVSKYGSKSQVCTESYFVGINPRTYSGCNIISVVTDPDNLFDAKKGIYVTGEIFDKYLDEGELDKNWRFWEANYTQRGKEWEREAVFQIFDEDGKFVLTKAGGIRTRGGVSRGTLPRGLNLYTREEYDGKDGFGVCLFKNDYEPTSVSLSSGGNQLITQFSDYMIAQKTKGLDYAIMSFEPYVLFLNGEYWGFYWMTEKFDETFLGHYYGVDAEQVVMIKNGELEIGNDRDILLYQNMLNYIGNNDMSINENYEKACELVDINSFLDYYATMIYIARCEDWPNDNFAVWRTREDKENGYADGKWRWMMFDCNSTSMRDDKGLVPHDTLTYVIENDLLFASLWDNESFRKSFEDSIMTIADSCFAVEEMNQFIENYNEQMIPILSESWARFYGSNNGKLKEYYDRMESHRIFFENRNEMVKSWFD